MYVIKSEAVTVSGTTDVYVPIPVTGRLVKASYVVTTDVTVAADTVTFAQGSSTIGTCSVAVAAAGTGAGSLTPNTTTEGKVEVGPTKPIKITPGGGSTAGVVEFALVISEYHADS
jgi:hypothetical protein